MDIGGRNLYKRAGMPEKQYSRVAEAWRRALALTMML